jgi:hypothetical protein
MYDCINNFWGNNKFEELEFCYKDSYLYPEFWRVDSIDKHGNQYAYFKNCTELELLTSIPDLKKQDPDIMKISYRRLDEKRLIKL